MGFLDGYDRQNAHGDRNLVRSAASSQSIVIRVEHLEVTGTKRAMMCM